MSGTHWDLLFGSKSRRFECKSHRWGLEPIETSYSGANHDVLHAQKDRWGLESIESCYSGPKVAVLHAQNDRWGLVPIETSISHAKHAVVHAQSDRSFLEPIDTCYSGPEVAVLHAKTTGGVLDPQTLVILVLKSLFWMHNTTGESWNQYGLFILLLSTLLCVLKNHSWGLVPI